MAVTTVTDAVGVWEGVEIVAVAGASPSMAVAGRVIVAVDVGSSSRVVGGGAVTVADAVTYGFRCLPICQVLRKLHDGYQG